MSNQELYQENVRVLIAEDDYLVGTMIKGLLEEARYTVIGEAANGLEAVEMTQSLQPDVVLMDIKLPYMDGIKATRRIHESCPTPVVMLTAYDTLEMVERASAAGAGAYLVKPLNVREMARAITVTIARFGDMMELRRLNAELQAEITERKRAEEALRESEERYHSLFDGVPTGLYRTTPDGRVLDGNPALIEMLGHPDRESLLAANATDWYVDAEDRQRWEALMEREGIVRGFEVQLHRHDGTVIWVRDTAQAVRDADGRALRYEGSLEDVTEHRRLEKQLRQHERLAAVGQLAGGIAHDFNNLLTTIMLYTQMGLRKRDLAPNVARSLETILDESQKAAELVQQILDFSRRAMIDVQPLDLRSFTEKVIAILRRTIPESIRLTLAMGTEEYVVEADSTRIQQALMNLATNGRDAMPMGGELRFELSRMQLKPDEEPPVAEMVPGEWVCLAVSDTGTGMTEEVRAHLFEPFFTTKGPGKGTGLGLAQVYGIVRQHEGYIGMETEMGKGTIFRIHLPACGAKEGVAEEEVAAIPQGQGETILLVEDNEGVREAGRGILESLGYRVLAAANGREALEVYETEDGADLVIADLVMPEMGGKELMQELRQANPDLKGLATTGYALQDNLETLKEAGFLDIVRKPLDAETLAQVVRRALDQD